MSTPCDYEDTPRCPRKGCLHPHGLCVQQDQPAALLDPEDRTPMAACAIAVLCFVVMAIAEVIPW